MSTIKSSTEHLTLNADGAGKEIKFQANGVEVASIDSTGALTVAGLTSTGIDDNATSTAITIDASENVGIGTTPAPWSSAGKLEVSGMGTSNQYSDSVSNAYYNSGWKYKTTGGATNIERNASSIYFRVAPSGTAGNAISWTTAMTIDSAGAIQNQKWYDETAGAAATAHITTYGQIKRSTSSIKYKKDVETMEDSYADAILTMRPVWYHSKCKGDPENYGYWGLIAEEVAAIDPRLVHWKDVEHTDVLNEETGETEKVFTPLAEPEAEGVQYDRIIPHLINLLKRQDTTIKSLEARVTALEV